MNPAQPLARPALSPRLLLPQAPVLTVRGRKAFWLTTDGECLELPLKGVAQKVAADMPLVCHAAATARRLGIAEFASYDLLELFAFIRPASSCAPSATGLARALSLLPPEDAEGEAVTLMQAARHLLHELSQPREDLETTIALARAMGGKDGENWPWAPFVLAALGVESGDASPERSALYVWKKLPAWPDVAPPPPSGQEAVGSEETKTRLSALLAPSRLSPRPQQENYAEGLTPAFAPRVEPGQPNLVLAEAGTGVGKTLGYLAPATLWAEKNKSPVWISTYTRNLQRQIETELARLYPDPKIRAEKTAVRKGRENYLCLLNFEEAVHGPAMANNPRAVVAFGLIARWIAATKDGDLTGTGFPGWLPSLLGWRSTAGLADRRGECIYAACPHYRSCFVEKSLRRAQTADIVIANHALVMHQTALAEDLNDLPGRYVFDEGHHLFESADGAFSLHLSGFEAADLRRWILGDEHGGKSRMRGLKRRIEDLVQGDQESLNALESALEAARALPGPGWIERLRNDAPKGAAETFLSLVQRQVLARNTDTKSPYSLETPTQPLVPGMLDAAYALSLRLNDLKRPLGQLAAALGKTLDENAATLDSGSVARIYAVRQGLLRRTSGTLSGWIDMLAALSAQIPPEFCDWMEIERIDGKDIDVALCRHWIDPMTPFAQTIREPAQGLAVTSATLRDPTEKDPEGWQSARQRLGAKLLDPSDRAPLVRVPSPFDYAGRTKIIVVRDVPGNDTARVAAAFRELFAAAGGGGLGLFTAVARLKAVHEKLAPELEKRDIPLYAQHVDPMDTATLIDIFRAEENACLLGTDAARDGIDVPGRSLRLIVYERVPWQRPTLLHKARRDAFGGPDYDDMLTRARLKQAYGRLIRRDTDKGVFVMLDSRLPSRLLTAFSEGVTVERTGLAEAVRIVGDFLKEE